MAAEIELKAHAADAALCEQKLTALAGPGQTFVKEDAYWFPKDERASEFPASGLRVRREEKAGTAKVVVTWKSKEKRDGIEINDEHEFTVDGDEAFCELLPLLNLEKRIEKRKAGKVWKIDGITAELCEVSGFAGSYPHKNLQWFLELEILAEQNDAQTVAACRERLLGLLAKAGIDQAALESRYYSEMLSES